MPPSNSRLSSKVLCLALSSIFFAANIQRPAHSTDGLWPVERGQVESISLTKGQGFYDLLLSYIYGTDEKVITLVEYSSAKEVSWEEREVVSTGRSLTFSIKDAELITNSVNGSGPKLSLPIQAYIHDGRIVSLRPQLPDNDRIVAILESVSLREEELWRDQNYSWGPSLARIRQAVENKSGSKVDLGYSDIEYCGYRSLREDSAFKGLNSIALSSLVHPFNEVNVFYKNEDDKNVSEMRYCKPNPNGVTCFYFGTFDGWLPYTLSFDSKNLCGSSAIAQGFVDFLSKKVVRETTAPKTNAAN